MTDGTDAPSPAIEEDSVFAFLVGGAEEEELSAIGGKAEMWSNSFVIQKTENLGKFLVPVFKLTSLYLF